jgi:tetratricopeptide (TPR) repeat protein
MLHHNASTEAEPLHEELVLPFFSRVSNRESVSPTPAASPIPLTARTLLAGVIALTALVYLPVLRYEFVYDDQGIIVDNPMIRSWRYLPQYFQGQLWQHLFPNAPSNYYRPLNLVLFRVNHALFGLRPMGWHAYALLLHLLATALVFCIVRRITERPLVAAIAGLLFGVHPSHHEVVAWISSTTESLCAVLFLAAFLAYLKSRERWTAGWMSVSCLLYAAGLLSKETAMVLPAVIFAHACLYGARLPDAQPATWRQRVFQATGRASVYVPVCIVYLAVRMHVLHGFAHSQNAVGFSSLLLTLPSVLFFYLQQWLVPIRFSEFYDLPLRTRWDLLHVALPLAALAAAAAALWYFRRRLGPREVAFALVAIAVPLLPAMNLSVFAQGEFVHDRYTYLPSLGAALIAGLALQQLCSGRLVFRMPQRLVLVVLAILLPLSYSTASASSYWHDDLVLFEHAHQVAPQNTTARNNYAIELSRSGDRGTAMTMLGDLVKEHPDSYLGNYNLGRLLYETNLLPAAEHYLRLSQKLDPSRPDPYLQLGMICVRTGRTDEAEAHFRRALSLRPDDATFHFALGVVMAQGGNCPAARAEFSQALLLDPALKRAQEQRDKCGADAAVRPPAGTPRLPARVPLVPVKGH